MATKGHTATAKNNSTYFSDLDKRLSTETSGVPQRARQKFTSAIGKTRSRTATRLAGKEPPTKGQKLITSLMQRTTPYKGAPTAPKTASEALSQAIRKNHQLLQKQPINKEGVA